MTQDQQIRQQLAKVLDWGEAHPDLHTVIDNFPIDLRGEVPPGFTHSAWELLEHLRIALWDIVEFTKDARHKSPPWPQGYWPHSPAPPQLEAWDQCVGSIDDLLEELRGIVLDRSRPLLEPIPRSQGQTIMREVLLAADHHAYHLGEIVQVRKALKAWPK
jgi:DinB family protein